MKINFVTGCPYEDKEGEILNLHVQLEKGESISLGDTIDILMMDDSYLQREVKIINPQKAGDYAIVSQKMAGKVQADECRPSKKRQTYVEGDCTCELVVMNVPYHEVKTDENIRAREAFEELQQRMCITPYAELNLGEDSILEHTKAGYRVQDKVIRYLQLGEAYMMCLGIYNHPFKADTQLLGPYTYSDGYYYWDRDTWKYVLKYGLVLPQEFIEYVMSDEGTEFIEQHIKDEDEWSLAIKQWKQSENGLCLLPDDAGNIALEDF